MGWQTSGGFHCACCQRTIFADNLVCGSPYGLVYLVVVGSLWSWVSVWSSLVPVSFAVVILSGASCSSSVFVFCVWLELPYERYCACVSSPVVVFVVVFKVKLWLSESVEKLKLCVLFLLHFWQKCCFLLSS